MDCSSFNLIVRKKTKWKWGVAQELAFQALKDALLYPPILKWYDPNRSIKLCTDASGTVIGGILQQNGKNTVSDGMGSRTRHQNKQSTQFIKHFGTKHAFCDDTK